MSFIEVSRNLLLISIYILNNSKASCHKNSCLLTTSLKKIIMKKRINLRILTFFLGSFFVLGGHAQRNMEQLDRGIVALRQSSSEVLISWRIPGDEYANNVSYNLYRGSTLIASGLVVSNYVDATSTDYSYSVAAVIGGVEQVLSASVEPLANQYFTIPVRKINGGFDTYNVNDASVGDLDGDGEYEIVVKRLANDATPSSTNYHYLEAYKLNGTFLWAINLGPNICNTVEVNFLVYDFDNDGKAEVATRTSDGMIDGVGKNIGDRDGDGKTNYRSTMVLNSSNYRIDGPDYISIFDGQTGQEIAWNWYIDREPLSQWGTPGMSDSQLGHRATKCMWAVAYIDGINPSFVISRGIYHRIKLEAWNFSNGSLTKQWAFDSDPNGVSSAYTGQGYHNLAAGDIDGDGRDEIIYGSMAVDEYGSGIYSTKYGHGDAGHLADINPNIAGLEFFGCLEGANGSTIPGSALRNAAKGSIQWQYMASGDIGRCMAADIDENFYGMEIWGADGSGLYSCTGTKITSTLPTSAGGGVTYNFGVWWDDDVQRELLDRTVITKWNSSSKSTDRVATLYNIANIGSNNGTKNNPCLMADILGDWREEIIYRSADNSGMVVFLTPFSTTQRMYTLMHDPNYRSAVAWQMNSYNQPPNLGFYFGGGMATPPVPNIKIVGKDTQTGNIALSATAGDGQVDLSWTSTLISTNYQVMRDTDNDPLGRTRIAITSNNVTNYTDTDVTNGTTYFYWIKSTDDNGNTINSDAASATPTACAGTTIIPYTQVDGGSWNNTNTATVDEGGTVKFGPWPTSGGSWNWSGPNSFSATTREIEIANITSNGAGNYTAQYTNSSGCVSSLIFTITVNASSNSTVTLTIQENDDGFCSVDGTIDNNNSGFTGDGFANTSNVSGYGVSWRVNIPVSGNYDLVWRYANGGSTDRSSQIMVNGSTVVSSVSMPSTGAWTTWSTTSGNTINLSAGDRIIRLQATNSSGLSNIDYMNITGVQPSGVGCVGEKSAVLNLSPKINEVRLYPNFLRGDKITLAGYSENTNDICILLYDETGQLVFSTKSEKIEKGSFTTEISLESIHEGIYFVKLILGNSVQTTSLIKQ